MQIPTCKAIILFVKDSADLLNGLKSLMDQWNQLVMPTSNRCTWRLCVNPVTWCVVKINQGLRGEKREKGESKWMVDRGLEKGFYGAVRGCWTPNSTANNSFYFLAETYAILLICNE